MKKNKKTSYPWENWVSGQIVYVDTAPFIYMLEDHAQFAPRFAPLFNAWHDGHINIALSSITLAEILIGPYKQGQLTLAKRYEKTLQEYVMVDISSTVARSAAEIRAQYGLKLPDALQLASSIEIGASLFVTHDRDFSKVSGVPIWMG